MTTTMGPALLLQYGRGGSYKSTLAAELAAYGGVAMAPPTGMEPAQSYLDIPIVEFGAERFAEGYKALPELMRLGYLTVFRPRSLPEAMLWMSYLRALGIWCVVFDDVSLFAHDEVSSMKKYEAAWAAAESRNADNRKVYGNLGEMGGELRKKAWELAMVVVINGHEKRREDGTISPDFPGKGMAKHLVHGASAVVRVAPHNSMYGSKQIGYHWSAPGSEAKNRVTRGSPPAIAPPSLRALLVDSGRECPRHPAMSWMDEVMHKVAEKVVAGVDYLEIQAIYRAWGQSADVNPAHLTWAIREGFALGKYQEHRIGGASYWNDMGIAPGAGGGLGLPPLPPTTSNETRASSPPAQGATGATA